MRSAVFMAGVLALACGSQGFATSLKRSTPGTVTIDLSDILGGEQRNGEEVIKTSDKRSAEKLVQAGESLLVPGGLIYADRLFNAALVIDPSNLRAQFYRRLVAPMRE